MKYPTILIVKIKHAFPPNSFWKRRRKNNNSFVNISSFGNCNTSLKGGTYQDSNMERWMEENSRAPIWKGERRHVLGMMVEARQDSNMALVASLNSLGFLPAFLHHGTVWLPQQEITGVFYYFVTLVFSCLTAECIVWYLLSSCPAIQGLSGSLALSFAGTQAKLSYY